MEVCDANLTAWWFALRGGAAAIIISSAVAQTQMPSESPIVRNLADVKFSQIPGAPDCFAAVIEKGDPGKEASMMLMRSSGRCTVPWYWHPSTEEVMMVSAIAQAQVKGRGTASTPSAWQLFVCSLPPCDAVQLLSNM